MNPPALGKRYTLMTEERAILSLTTSSRNDFMVPEGSEIKEKCLGFEMFPFKEIGRQKYTLEAP